MIDTLRSTAPPPDPDLVVRVAGSMGMRAGVAEDHCRRVTGSGRRGMSPPFDLQVRNGAVAVVVANVEMLDGDSASLVLRRMSGTAVWMPGSTTYDLRRSATGWLVGDAIARSHGPCPFRADPPPFILAAQTLLSRVDAVGAICIDRTGYPLAEAREMAEALGAEGHGHWMPPLDTGHPPEPYDNPCGRDGTDWGAVMRVRHVDWVSDDEIHIVMELRLRQADTAVAPRVERGSFELRRTSDGWVLVDAEVAPGLQ